MGQYDASLSTDQAPEDTQGQLVNHLSLYPSNSSHSLELGGVQLPEDHPLNMRSFGDSELDKLVKQNLTGLLRSRKLKKRQKKTKNKTVEEVSFCTQNSNQASLVVSYASLLPYL